MNHEQLKVKAKELGIPQADIEAFDYKQLQKAVKAKEESLVKLKGLQTRAEELGLDHEGVSAADLQIAIEEEEAELAKIAREEAEAALRKEKVDLVANHLGLEKFDDLSLEDLQKELTVRDETLTKEAIASLTPVVDAKIVSAEPEGKTDEVFKASNGKKYGFNADAPAAFRYCGSLRTQKEWIKDKEAMQLMVSGNLSYLTLIDS